jgi:DivIVA domain-containing protein
MSQYHNYKKLSAKDIYEKDFEKTMARGYRREEVDAFLDDIITDYQKSHFLIISNDIVFSKSFS